jgi:hypothetical protein
MSKDVLITPASGNIVFNNTNVTKAQIELDSSNNLVISTTDGDVTIGTPGSNLFVGDGINSVDIVFEQSGSIRALTGKTLTLGQNDSNIIVASPVTFNNVTVSGDLTVNGTTTTINSTTISVDDKNIELGSVASPTNTTADGGGITLKGSTDKTFNWVNATGSWTSSENINVPVGKSFLAGNASGNDYSEFLHNNSSTSLYGVSLQYQYASAILNRQGSTEQVLFVGDAGPNTAFPILGASISTDSGANWLNVFRVNADGNVVGSRFTGDTVYINSSDDYISATSGVESWIYSKDFSVSGQESEPRDLEFSSDGTKLYVLGNSGNDITQYNLSTAWDIGTASASSTFSVGTQETAPYGLFFKPDGTRFFVAGAKDIVYRYDLSTAWDITTASYVNSFSVTAQETDPQGISFSSDGTKMYITGTSGDDINQYNLGTAWDITTAVYSTVFNVSAYASAPQGLAFSSDGTKFWIVGSTFNRIAEFTMSTPWSIATASYSGAVNVGLLGTYAVLGSSGIYVNLSQNKAWISDYQNDRVFELSTNIAATKLYGSKWLVEPDLHLEQDLVVNKNTRINGSLYMPGYISVGNMDVSGTLNVRAALDLADNDVLRLGSSDDWEMYHSSTDSNNYIDLTVGNLIIRDDGTSGDPVRFTFERTTGNFTASTITSNVATGTAPFSITSTTRVANLNVDTAGSADTATKVVVTVTGTNSAELVRGNMGDNDQARILVGATATNAGFLEIATADDGTEPIYVRQYTGVFSTLARTATLLDGSGNTSFPGTVTANGTTLTGNTGTVTSVGGTGTVSGLTLSGTVTSSGNLTLGGTLAVTPSNFSSQTANTFLAAPNGSAGVPTFRAIVAADIPTLNQNTTGSAATLTTARTINGTSFNGSANITTANWGTARTLTIGSTGKSVNGSANISWSLTEVMPTTSNVQINSLGIGTAASGTAGEIRATNNITAYYSDDRLKTRIGNIENALEKISSLNGFYHEANETAQSLGYEKIREVGVSAQEVEKVLPEVVTTAPISNKYLTVRYERMVPLLIEAIKELKKGTDLIPILVKAIEEQQVVIDDLRSHIELKDLMRPR